MLILVDSKPFQFEVGEVTEVVDDEALGLAHDPDAGVVVSEVDNVKSAQLGHEVDVLEQSVLSTN